MTTPRDPQERRTIPLAEISLPHRCPRPVRMTVLDRSAYFHGLGEEALDRIDRRMRTSTWAEEEAIYRAGESAETLYVVAEGRVRIGEESAAGTRTVTDILGPGEMFGAMSSLGEPVHTRSATALVNSCTLRIGQDAFREVLVENPEVGLRVVDDLAARLGRAEAGSGGQGTGSVEQRVARALLRLGEKFGRRSREGLLLEVPLSRADLAGLARSTPESVSRVMSRWKKDGVVDSGRRWTALKDVEQLEGIAEPEG